MTMSYYALMYEVVDDYVERRSEFRSDHLRLADAARRRGELLAGGALGDPADGALLVFRVPDPDIVEDFARNDPYVMNGLVTSWQLRPWKVVAGTVLSMEL